MQPNTPPITPSPSPFIGWSDEELIKAAFDESIGYSRGRAIWDLAIRALSNNNLLEIACRAISGDRRIGIHTLPSGWFGADEIYLSGQQTAIRALLNEMNSWDEFEQKSLVLHWAGSYRLAELTKELKEKYGWTPRYPADSM
jgi:hypothetical protein